MIDPTDDDFGVIINCAVRYAIGRQSYMPSLVIDFTKPLLPYLTDRTLGVIQRDIEEAPSYGDSVIDKPYWLNFLEDVKEEKEKRNNAR